MMIPLLLTLFHLFLGPTMKCVTSPDHSRKLIVSEIPADGRDCLTSLEIVVSYVLPGGADKGIPLDRYVVPAIKRGLNLDPAEVLDCLQNVDGLIDDRPDDELGRALAPVAALLRRLLP
jgi:hypothetical protein